MQNNVMRILTFLHILQKHTDSKHALSREELTQLLAEAGYDVNRKTFYEYIKQLIQVGYPVVALKSGNFGYYLPATPFSFAQAKLLVDAVQTSRVLPKETSTELIGKISSTMSQYESAQLRRKLYLSERPKTINKNIYQHIDKIYEAISNNRRVSFRYFDWILNHKNEKEKRYRHDGLEYKVSPYSLVWADDNYYMVAHYPSHDALSNFRVDRMDLVMICDEKRVPLSQATNDADFNLPLYSQRLFSMFVGKTQQVTMLIDADLLSAMLDRFGHHANLKRVNGQIEVNVSLEVSPPFLAWIFQFKDKIKILSPHEVQAQFLAHIRSVLTQYEGE
jgi:predicted DNA-binding transcriptional regulator YafY